MALGGSSVTREVAVAIGQGCVEGHDRLRHGSIQLVEQEQATVGVCLAEGGGDDATLSIDEAAQLVFRGHSTSEVEAQVQRLSHLLAESGFAGASRADEHHWYFSSNSP